MGDNLRLKMQNINLGAEDEPVAMPPAMCVQAAAVNRFSLVVVPLNLRKQNLRAMISQLPRLWGIENAVGRIIAANRIQFVFPSEESMLMVTRRAPWSFAEWMVTVSRWYPNIADEDLKIIPFWVQIRGIPLEFLTREVVEFIGGILAPVFNVDFDENSTRVDFVHVQVLWNADHPLRFQRNYQFSPDVNTLLSFKYERLRNFCQTCGLLTHEKQECPLGFDDDHVPSDPDDDDDEGGDDDKGLGPTETNLHNRSDVGNDQSDPTRDAGNDEEEAPMDSDALLGNNKRKRNQEMSGDADKSDEVAAPEVDDKMFWKSAPLVMVTAEYGSRMGDVRTLRKHNFIKDMLKQMESDDSLAVPKDNPLALISEDEDADHIILEMEDRREARLVSDSLNSLMMVDQNVQMVERVDEAPSLKRNRQEDVCVDKYQVGKKIVAAEFHALKKICVDYGQEDELLLDAGVLIDRGAVGPVPPPVP
ncbi:hypothetical protein BRARA_A02574 [Brassica rapa]|uniref:DUF4283 domain-containing protein n=1 Tax=Brassica campestris TaxID=3711 RepID=A0A398AW51_BRACM|nr:hypothetical protein BRARA_A02574 [Brassica rapa]